MHMAVEKGDKEGKKFTEYIDYLQQNGYITNSIKNWSDSLRQIGNDSTHHIKKPDSSRCKSTLMFTTELLRIVYEMEHLAKEYTANPTSKS